jgi:hypothetical protein
VLGGATVSDVKRQRRIDVSSPLKAHMLAMQEAIALAELADQWQAPPTRADQRLALVRGVEHRWTAGEVPRNAGGMRCWQTNQQRTAPRVVVTPALRLNAPWNVRHYEERPEIAQDYAQMKSGGWQLQKRRSTR